jgi:HSP20 family protein
MIWDNLDEFERMRRKMLRTLRPWMEEVDNYDSFPVDVAETEDELAIKADLPGFDKEEIQIKATENNIDIAAQHKEKKIERTEKMFRAERKFGAVRRSFTLPVEVKPETAKTSFEKGVLEIKFKKAKPTKKVREIKVE